MTILGCGDMGSALGFRLLEKNIPVTVWNRSMNKTEDLVKAGATAQMDVRSAIQYSNIVLMILTTGEVCQNVLNQAATAVNGRTVINMSSIMPEESKSLAAIVTEAGGQYLEAPVSGTPVHIKRGVLSILCAGDAIDIFDATSDFLSNFGTPKWIGSLGQACAMKMAINSYMAIQVAGFAFSTAVCRHAGLAADTFMETIKERGQFHSPHLEFIGPSMFTRHYEPAMFKVELMLKDVNQGVLLAEEQGVDTGLLRAVGEIASRLVNNGKGYQNYSVLYEGIDPPH